MKKPSYHFGSFALALLLSALPLAACAALQIQSWTLSNGARVLFVENHAIAMLDVSIEFDAGTRRDPATKAGTAALTNLMLTRGVAASGEQPALNESQILDGLADVAAQRGDSVSQDRAGITLRTLSSLAERQIALDLLARLLAQPTFPVAALDRDKARTIARIREAQTKPEEIASRAFWSALYGDHPYAHQQTAESVATIEREDLVAFHRQHYVANRAVITMIGDITRSDADQIAQRLTAQLSQGAALPALPIVAVAAGSELRIAHPASQSHILIGMPALVRGDPDFFALTVGNYILGGGGFVSRLTSEVREKRGLTYSVYSYFSPLAQPGPFQIGLQTKREQTDEALAVVRKTVASYLKNGPTDAELKAAKDNLTGGFALRIDNNRKLLDTLAVIGFYQMPLNYLDTWTRNISKVSIAQIKAAFQRKLAFGNLNTIVVGQSGAEAQSK
ncbi:zinc protease [Herbaspirillum sp. Sphag1AN]|uniref:M16 family metallopeptidase n=1 Tax=unclassified Herbaspirillum TaxID=2624150 RepID=UPI00161A180D|nr:MULTISPECIES: pitrilysin family protein [unclassified Herbaspirillum]MBB3212628.1 zinc protease [Herbaspirillum sp. Sphag1AN]MBB3245825.1 zinc protease [Herbaspirillum sp. Sphag64]